GGLGGRADKAGHDSESPLAVAGRREAGPPMKSAYENSEQVTALVARVLAENPTIMTGPGTNTWIVGTDPVVVIDVGPDDERHLAAVTAGVAGRTVEAVLCTHHHIDHAPGTAPFAASVDAPVLARVHADG